MLVVVREPGRRLRLGDRRVRQGGGGIIGEGGERGSKEGHRMREEDGEGTKPRRQKSIRVWLRGQRRECIE